MMTQQPPSQNLDQTMVYGHVEPRKWTPPLRELTPETSYGFAVIEFARDVLQEPLDPWQSWLAIHMGELLPNGEPRFRQALIIVARQNGKTHLLVVLALFWLFVEQWPLVLGMSTNLQAAREAWEKAVQRAEKLPAIRALMPKNGVRRANGNEHLAALDEDGNLCRYLIAASNRNGGRGYSTDRLILDELREHHDWEAWNASTPGTLARSHGQIIAITNQGDDRSIVLDSLRESALKSLEDETSYLGRDGIFEWSAPDDSDISDPNVWAYANPNLGYRIPLDAIKGPALRALEAGGVEEAGFRTEMLCMRVRSLDAAVDARKWAACYVPGDLKSRASETVWGFDVNRQNTRATLVAALKENGTTRLQVIGVWENREELTHVADDLLRLINENKPRKLVWLPIGPSAGYATTLKDRYGAFLTADTEMQQVTAEVTDAAMGFANAVYAEQIQHDNNNLLNDHVTGAQKLWSGDRWKFSRKGKGSSDAVYAAAAAWHVANVEEPPEDWNIFTF